jgi:hypothetical protein
MRQLLSVSTKISLMLCVLVAIGGLTPRLNAHQNEEPKRSYTVNKSVLPETVLEIVEARHLDGENFPAQMELVVRNLSDKPIFGIYVMSIFQGSKTGMSLYFGRPPLAFCTEPPTADDQPLLPGKLGILRVEPGIAKGTHTAIKEGRLPMNLTMELEILFQTLSFGDGTGYQLKNKQPFKKS